MFDNTAYARMWRAKNRSKCREYQRQYRLRHIVKVREKNRANAVRWRAANPEYSKQKTKRWRGILREMVLALYGHLCECCGDRNKEFLCLDHKYGGGNIHRKSVHSTSLYLRLTKGLEDKSLYRLLCHNCNFSNATYGYCPHKAEEVKK